MYNPVSPNGVVGFVQDTARQPERAVSLREVGRFLRGSLTAILGGAVVCAVLALAYVLLATPTYLATASLIIDPNKAHTILDNSTQQTDPLDFAQVDSQAQVVQSDAVATIVINKLHLLDDPEFKPSGGGILSYLTSWLKAAPPPLTPEQRAQAAMRYALDVFGGRLDAHRIGQSYLIQATFRSNDADKAALIANAVADAYIEQDLNAKSDALEKGSQWLDQRLAALRGQANDAVRAYEHYKAMGDAQTSSGDASAKLAELQGASETYRQIYETFLQKFTEAVQKVSFPVADARVISAASKPSAPTPKPTLVILFAAVFGAFIGTGVSFARRSMDRGLRSPRQLEQETGLDCLGTVGRLGRPAQKARKKTGPDGAEGATPESPADNERALTVDLRQIKASINAGLIGRKSRCIGIVSVDKGEGATTIASYLSVLYAVSGNRTLLVDGSLENPTVSRNFAPDAEAGLMQVLDDRARLADLVLPQTRSGLFVLPIGKAESAATPGDRIGSEKSALRIDDIRQNFDTIIFDLPALATSPDARAIAPFLDGIVLVATYGRTSAGALSHAAMSLRAIRANPLGVVVNKMSARDRKIWTE
ncbi:polysaccharide biosynthesis tyrosine autokinase [Labrys monachus]|uniref:Capsular exopolysaccharide synthesis family protein n=1 Tax=Labrys monachus TaxID=217067 RepID=A0ABU0FA81_9HYPH|nr:polysaccharide biosynthesis tyrosine autokinase [Labrys monachus]MDQ0391446.1 capsular exopolysaccharide synthesis family protein [Labrys monachus]